MAAEAAEAETQEELVDLPTVQVVEQAAAPSPRPGQGQTAETNVIIRLPAVPAAPRPLVQPKQSVPGQTGLLLLPQEQCLPISLAPIQPKTFPLLIKKLMFAPLLTLPTG